MSWLTIANPIGSLRFIYPHIQFLINLEINTANNQLKLNVYILKFGCIDLL